MSTWDLDGLRADIEAINFSLLDLLSRRARLVTEIHAIKSARNIPLFVPAREEQMLERLVARNEGPFSDAAIRGLFKEIFRASLDLQETQAAQTLMVGRERRPHDLVITVKDAVIGGPAPVLIAGPCSVEGEEQMEQVARLCVETGVKLLRGGAFKPRSSPYSFQGLGARGLELLARTARRHGLATVTEVTDTRLVGLVAEHADVLQIGARNMHNVELLREVGRTRRPVLLKRGLAATIEEFLFSAEYIIAEGNDQIILCERGIRTYETATRNTLDIAAVPLLRQRSYLPVVVDVSHAAGRRDILAPLGRAALAAGASGLMVEVHPAPHLARSDAEQQLDFAAFRCFCAATGFTPPA
ncbi:MAG TPA: bifunctional 3-deoxy-7-phosphoheptulonate synthase/chorismate mutase [Polyangia bacterium]|jgi:3-deoxy-7-phosphoheptulonate synthase/chorismate mutase